MPINITISNFKAIKILLRDKYVAKSIFSSKKLLEEFIGCNCIYISGKPQQIYLNDEEALLGVIKTNGYKVNSIEDLDYFIKKMKILKVVMKLQIIIPIQKELNQKVLMV